MQPRAELAGRPPFGARKWPLSLHNLALLVLLISSLAGCCLVLVNCDLYNKNLSREETQTIKPTAGDARPTGRRQERSEEAPKAMGEFKFNLALHSVTRPPPSGQSLTNRWPRLQMATISRQNPTSRGAKWVELSA